MDNKKLLKIAVIIELYGIVMCYLFGLLYALTGKLQSYHVAFLELDGLNVETLLASNPHLAGLISVFIMLIGFALLGLSTTWLYVIVKRLAAGDKGGWIINLIAYLLVVVPFTFVTQLVGGLPFYVLLTILIADAVAIVLSLKPCLAKPAK